MEEQKCSVCGKPFIRAGQHLYKVKEKYHHLYQCSYTCWRKAGGDPGRDKFLRGEHVRK